MGRQLAQPQGAGLEKEREGQPVLRASLPEKAAVGGIVAQVVDRGRLDLRSGVPLVILGDDAGFLGLRGGEGVSQFRHLPVIIALSRQYPRGHRLVAVAVLAAKGHDLVGAGQKDRRLVEKLPGLHQEFPGLGGRGAEELQAEGVVGEGLLQVRPGFRELRLGLLHELVRQILLLLLEKQGESLTGADKGRQFRQGVVVGAGIAGAVEFYVGVVPLHGGEEIPDEKIVEAGGPFVAQEAEHESPGEQAHRRLHGSDPGQAVGIMAFHQPAFELGHDLTGELLPFGQGVSLGQRHQVGVAVQKPDPHHGSLRLRIAVIQFQEIFPGRLRAVQGISEPGKIFRKLRGLAEKLEFPAQYFLRPFDHAARLLFRGRESVTGARPERRKLPGQLFGRQILRDPLNLPKVRLIDQNVQPPEDLFQGHFGKTVDVPAEFFLIHDSPWRLWKPPPGIFPWPSWGGKSGM